MKCNGGGGRHSVLFRELCHVAISRAVYNSDYARI